PGVSLPSSVMWSSIETAFFRPHSFEDFLIDGVVYLATRSSTPMQSTGPTSSKSRRKAAAGVLASIGPVSRRGRLKTNAKCSRAIGRARGPVLSSRRLAAHPGAIALAAGGLHRAADENALVRRAARPPPLAGMDPAARPPAARDRRRQVGARRHQLRAVRLDAPDDPRGRRRLHRQARLRPPRALHHRAPRALGRSGARRRRRLLRARR